MRSQRVGHNFRKGRGTRDQIANICWIMEKARESHKNIYLCFIDMPKPLTVWITINFRNSERDGNTRPSDLSLRNNYASQKAKISTGHGTTDSFQIGKGVHQGCILSPCLFNLYAEYLMGNAGLVEAQASVKIARRNINNVTYADDTTLMAEGKEELKSLLMKVTEEREKVG